MKSVAEHHLEAKSEKADFYLSAENLKPYLLTEGVWLIRPRFICTRKPLARGTGPYSSGLRLVTTSVTTQNEAYLPLAVFPAALLEQQSVATFKEERFLEITRKTERIYFRLETLGGDLVALGHENSLVAGFDFIQTPC